MCYIPYNILALEQAICSTPLVLNLPQSLEQNLSLEAKEWFLYLKQFLTQIHRHSSGLGYQKTQWLHVSGIVPGYYVTSKIKNLPTSFPISIKSPPPFFSRFSGQNSYLSPSATSSSHPWWLHFQTTSRCPIPPFLHHDQPVRATILSSWEHCIPCPNGLSHTLATGVYTEKAEVRGPLKLLLVLFFCSAFSDSLLPHAKKN